MAHDVFISYSHKDKVVADAICARLEQDGARCWYAPRDITPGADWAGAIIEAINNTKIMVLVFTDFSNSSQQVMREISNAVSSGVTIVPFKLTESLPTQSMQYYLSTVHWLDAINRPLANSIEQLNDLVQALLNGTAPRADDVRFTSAAPTGKTRPSWLVPAIAAAAVIIAVIALVVVLNPFGGGSSGSGSATASASASAASAGGTELATIAVPAKGSAQIANPDNTGTLGNLQGNYQNGGYAASDGEWFYYRSNDGSSMYKMRLDGSEKTKLNDQSSSYIGVVDGTIYYYSSGSNSGIWRMGTDGSKNSNIYIGTIEDMSIVGDRIYFKNSLDELKLYSMTLSGTDIRKESDIEELYYLTIWDGKMYWSNAEDKRCLYRANLDGSDATKLTEDEVDSITVADGWLMYNDLGDHYLHLMNLDTLETYQVMSNGIYDPVISSYGVVGQSSIDSLYLYRAEVGGAGGNVLLREKTDGIAVAEGYIFYYNKADRQMYMMDIYGENILLL